MRLINALDAGWLLKALGVVKPLAEKTFDYIPFTPLFNASGQPAMSVPLHWSTASGPSLPSLPSLPIGLQFATRLGGDAPLFRLAGQLEQARPWFDRVPPGF